MPDFRELFHKAVLSSFGAYENLELIESRVKHLRSGLAITYHDLETIGDSTLWPFNSFWAWPEEKQIYEKLASTMGLMNGLLNNGEENEINVIKKLNSIFKNIGLVSILLRFIYPERYGIYSPPVTQVTKVERGKNDLEDYINYLKRLREILEITDIRETYKVSRVADVDMLLLAVSQLQGETLDDFNKLYIIGFRSSILYLIDISDEFINSIKPYDDKRLMGRILEAILHLSKNPMWGVGQTVKPLRYVNEKKWRYRIGDFRLIYSIDDDRKMVQLLEFGPRGDIYE